LPDCFVKDFNNEKNKIFLSVERKGYQYLTSLHSPRTPGADLYPTSLSDPHIILRRPPKSPGGGLQKMWVQVMDGGEGDREHTGKKEEVIFHLYCEFLY
jgi:hypothetical protein